MCSRRLWPGFLPSHPEDSTSPGPQSCMSSGPPVKPRPAGAWPLQGRTRERRPSQGRRRPELSDGGEPVPDARKPVSRQLSLLQSGFGRRRHIDRSLQPCVPAGEESIRQTLPACPRRAEKPSCLPLVPEINTRSHQLVSTLCFSGKSFLVTSGSQCPCTALH